MVMKFFIISAFKRKFVFVQTLVLAFLLIALSALSSCTDINNDAYPTAQTLKLEFGYINSAGAFTLAPAFLYTSLDTASIISNFNDVNGGEYGYPMVIKLTLPKNIGYKWNTFWLYDWENFNHVPLKCLFYDILFLKNDCAPNTPWYLDKDCEMTNAGCFFAVNIPLFFYEETDSTYELTTQIKLNGEVIGLPIFFIEQEYFAENFCDFSYGERSMHLIPAVRSGFLRMEGAFDINKYSNNLEFVRIISKAVSFHETDEL